MFKSKLIFLPLIAFILTSCGLSAITSKSSSDNDSQKSLPSDVSGSSPNSNNLKPFKVYDVYLDDAIPDPCNFVLEEFADQTFYLDEKVRITSNSYGTVVDYSSAVYIYDANDDGYRDFCTVKSDGSGVIYWYVTIYDLHNQKEIFKHWERPRFSYFLTLKENDLYVRQVSDYYQDDTINEGKLSFNKDKGVFINWNKNYDIADFDVKITYADPKHTPVVINKQKDVYNVIVDGVSQYFFDIDIHTNTDYGEEYIPVSFAMPANKFSISKISKKSSLQRYCFFFSDGSGFESTTLITISNITKTFVFSIRSGSTYQTIGDIISWSKDVTTNNLTMFETEFEMKFSNSFRHISRYYTKDAFSNALSNFNQIVFEVSPDDFDLLEQYRQSYYIYRFFVDEKVYTYQAVSTFIESSGKWYKVRSILSMGYYDESENLFAFPSDTSEVSIFNLDDTETGKSVDYLDELVFSKTTRQESTAPNAQFYFVINGSKYYILSPKTFVVSEENYRYLYTITNDKDFSSLF